MKMKPTGNCLFLKAYYTFSFVGFFLPVDVCFLESPSFCEQCVSALHRILHLLQPAKHPCLRCFY
ncbi:hypothetical protein BX070DRAFT_228349 [Coemansia spiralis]|nr:hypothetical protein BX070DRAFT_228349 [Coemansia spiralis]